MTQPSTRAAKSHPGSSEVRPYADVPNGAGPVWKAVLAGFAVDLSGTALLVVAIGFGFGASLADSGVSRAEAEALFRGAALKPEYFVPALLWGLAMSCLGGYVCARMAGGAAFRAGIILAALSVVLGLLTGDELFPLWAHALVLVFTGAAIMLGVRLGSTRPR